MPIRMIRDGLLNSERYWSVTIEARQLFVHLMLIADDLGCVSLAPTYLRRQCFDSPPQDKKITALITQLHDADLVRVYEVDGSKYGFIPRFGQRLRFVRLKNPKPPQALFSDDLDSIEKFNKVRDLPRKMAVNCPQSADNCPPEVEVELKLNRKEVEGATRTTSKPVDKSKSKPPPENTINGRPAFLYKTPQEP